jgi:hypothetical protein
MLQNDGAVTVNPELVRVMAAYPTNASFNELRFERIR